MPPTGATNVKTHHYDPKFRGVDLESQEAD
jgi:hypothetical protein